MDNNMRIEVIEGHPLLEAVWGGNFPKASQKGYPSFYDGMKFWVLFIDEEPVGYTGSLEMESIVFVGNTFVRKEWRSKGLHRHILKVRNSSLPNKTKITILNPLKGTQMKNLESVVSSLGYTKVESYEDVEDCMHQRIYEDIENHNIWRLDSDSGENEEE
jgi:hypothetical protein